MSGFTEAYEALQKYILYQNLACNDGLNKSLHRNSGESQNRLGKI